MPVNRSRLSGKAAGKQPPHPRLHAPKARGVQAGMLTLNPQTLLAAMNIAFFAVCLPNYACPFESVCVSLIQDSKLGTCVKGGCMQV